MARMIFLIIVCACLVGACGHPSVSGSTSSASVSSVAQASAPAASAPAASAPTASAPAASGPAAAAAPGCGTYCQQAGNSAGNAPPGYPCSATGCLQCPSQSCVSLQSSAGAATNGVVPVKLSCNLSTACRGAFLLCLPGALCESGFGGGRLAGSDFVIPSGTTSDVPVALTTAGQQIASDPGGFKATVLVDLLDYGTVLNTTGIDTTPGNFSLTSTDPPTYPTGATASCGGTVFVGPDTSCPFAENVVQAYTNAFGTAVNGVTTVTASSPVTGQTYTMRCTSLWPVACRGGTNALVEFYP